MTTSKAEPSAGPRPPEAPLPGLRRNLTLAGVILAIVIVFIDQLSKILAERSLGDGSVFTVIPGFLSLQLARNHGAAWGMFSGYSWLLFVTGVAVAALALIFLRRLTEGYTERYIAVFIILGGVFGNSIDRMWRRHVVDFFAVDLQFYQWPIFNVADIAICVGVGLFLLSTLLRPDRRKRRVADEEPA